MIISECESICFEESDACLKAISRGDEKKFENP
jgi:hypothetical protein